MDTLASIGVKRIYGVPDDSLNGITDAIRAQSIAWIHTRNEEAAAFAAGGEAHRNLAVCAGRCGPGNTHGRQIASGEFKPSMPKILRLSQNLKS